MVTLDTSLTAKLHVDRTSGFEYTNKKRALALRLTSQESEPPLTSYLCPLIYIYVRIGHSLERARCTRSLPLVAPPGLIHHSEASEIV
jgi:hypothetical protein